MKRVIKTGHEFSLMGERYKLERVEGAIAIVRVMSIGKTIAYGREALERIIRQYGYTMEG